jgi:hypothetical protein
MKALCTIFVCLLCSQLKAQNTYNNKIGEVKELNIYGKDANVIIGKIITNQSLDPPPIKLLEKVQEQQPDGSWFTAFAFGHNSANPIYNVNLKLIFSKPVDSLAEDGVQYFIGPMNTNVLSKDNLSYSFIASEIHASINQFAAFVIRIKSKYKIETTITGVDAN